MVGMSKLFASDAIATRTHCFGQLCLLAGESAASRRISSTALERVVAQSRSCTPYVAAYVALAPSVAAARRAHVQPAVVTPDCTPARDSHVDLLQCAT